MARNTHMQALCWCLLLSLGWTGMHGARILGIFPTASISHQLPFQAVMKALAARGHQVTVISTDPLKIPVENYTDIDLSFTYEVFQKEQNFNDFLTKSPYQVIEAFIVLGERISHLQLSSDAVQHFIRSREKFDLAFIESISYQSFYGLIHHVGSPPIIGILSLGGMASSFDHVGNPNNPSYEPDLMWPFDQKMTFWQRMNNMIYITWVRYQWNSVIIPMQEKIMRQYFGSEPPPIRETDRNLSLVMVNNHWTMSYPRPLLPNLIELGNLHLKWGKNPLPEDLAGFLDGAVDGFIYFSLGSNVRSDKLSPEKRQFFLDAFAALPQRVLWKWESDEMPGKPQNVMLGKWLPQSDILAHPNIRLFMTQGGLQSMGEAVQNAVPMVGIPFMGDQRYNVRKMVSAGIGQELDFLSATRVKILRVVKTVLTDPSYRQNMKKFSVISKDQPETALERAVWWTEYVLRHKGAPHLRSAALDLSWFQYLLLDVFAFLAVSLVAVLLLLYLIVRKCLILLCKGKSKNGNIANASTVLVGAPGHWSVLDRDARGTHPRHLPHGVHQPSATIPGSCHVGAGGQGPPGHRQSIDPLKPPRENYTGIALSFTYKYFQSHHDMNTCIFITPYQTLENFITMGEEVTRM